MILPSQEALYDGSAAPLTSIDIDTQKLLNNDQQAYADLAIKAMSSTLGLLTNDVRVVIDSTGGIRHAVAIDASPNGQFIGIYSKIQAERVKDPDWYTIVVAGERVDPLAFCTRSVYQAMIDTVRASGERFLPDSLALSQQNGHVWTATLMTGEPLDSEGKIWIGSSSSHAKVNFVGQDTNRGGKSFRVRPCVSIGHING